MIDNAKGLKKKQTKKRTKKIIDKQKIPDSNKKKKNIRTLEEFEKETG